MSLLSFKIYVVCLMTLFSVEVFPTNQINTQEGFFPENQLVNLTALEYGMQKQSLLSETIEDIQNHYRSIFSKNTKKLFIDIDWENPQVNAYATRDDNNNPVIKITGGLLAHKLLDKDALTIILCHEIGHFLGGYPKKLRGRSTKRSWSSAEGQADYYALAYCAKKMLAPTLETVLEEDSELQDELESICSDSRCQRLAKASFNVAKIYASTVSYPVNLSLINKEDYITYQTIFSHPSFQCRLDTMLSALKCENSEQITFDDRDPIQGTCEQNQYKRPRCWFYPNELL